MVHPQRSGRNDGQYGRIPSRHWERRLPIVSAVTAYDHETEGPILIGHGQVAWNERPEHTECLINSHSLRQKYVPVDNVTMRGRSDVINSRVAPRMIIDPGTEIDIIGGVNGIPRDRDPI